MFKLYILNTLVAAALGAGTNELAIIAILRYILPRKKSELARRIRDIVSTDLISPEKMVQKLDDPQVGHALKNHIDAVLEEFLERDLPSPDALLSKHRDDTDALVRRLRDSLLDEFSRRVSSPDFTADVIRPFLTARWQVLRKRTPASFLTRRSEDLPALAGKWAGSLESAAALREGLRASLDNWLAERISGAVSPAEVLSPGLAAAAEELAVSQAPVIVKQLTDLLRDENMQNTIAAGIMNAIHGQLEGQGLLGGVKGMLVNAIGVRKDVIGVCRRLPDTLEENFHRPMNHERFVASLRSAVREGLAQELGDDLRSAEKRERLVTMIVDGIWRDSVFARMTAGVEAFVAEGLEKSLEETLARLGTDDMPDEIFDELAERSRRILAHSATRELLERQIDEFVVEWRVRPLGRLNRFVSTETRERLAEAAAREGRELLRQRLGDLAREAGIWDIVTTSIEGYDNRQLSDMVVQLARAELRWVTVLGGVIGAMVGILQTWVYSLGLF